MANERLSLLSAIVLVAVLSPIVADGTTGCCTWFREDDHQLSKKLLDDKTPFEEVSKILLAIRDKRRTKFGKLSVLRILELADQTGSSKADCRYQVILERRHYVMDSNLIPSVWNFVNYGYKQLLLFCQENFYQFYEDNLQIVKLNDKELTRKQAREILLLIRDKENVKIGDLRVQAILDQASNNGPSVDDCHYNALARRESYQNHHSISSIVQTLVSNLRNFDEPSYRKLLSFCAKNIERVFETSLTYEQKKSILQFPSHSSAVDTFNLNSLEHERKVLCSHLDKSIRNVLFILKRTQLPESLNKGDWPNLIYQCKTYLDTEATY